MARTSFAYTFSYWFSCVRVWGYFSPIPTPNEESKENIYRNWARWSVSWLSLCSSALMNFSVFNLVLFFLKKKKRKKSRKEIVNFDKQTNSKDYFIETVIRLFISVFQLLHLIWQYFALNIVPYVIFHSMSPPFFQINIVNLINRIICSMLLVRGTNEQTNNQQIFTKRKEPRASSYSMNEFYSGFY